MNRQQFGIAVLGGELVRALDGFLRFDGEFVPTDGHDLNLGFGNRVIGRDFGGSGFKLLNS